MTNEEYMALAKRELDSVLEIIKRKNADYTAGSNDPFANFSMCEVLGLADKEIGVLVRMVDKIQRVKSFIKNGELQVKNESVQDALRDIIGYSLVLLGMTESEKGPTAEELCKAWTEFQPEQSFDEFVKEQKDLTKITVTEPFLTVSLEGTKEINKYIKQVYNPSGAI